MAYVHYDDTVPDGATQTPTEIGDSSRSNMQALAHSLIMNGSLPGWNVATADDDGTEPATTPDTPERIIFKKGTEWVIVVLTYNGNDDVTVAESRYSTNSGSTYDTIGTFTITYDGSGNFQSAAWS